jgi:hypothetical protein
MSTMVWIASGLGAWLCCGVLAVAVASAARRGDRLSGEALMGAAAVVEQPRPRMAVDVTPVPRPWAAARTSPVVASVLAEAQTG